MFTPIVHFFSKWIYQKKKIDFLRKALADRQLFIQCLDDAGLEHWELYESALEIYRQRQTFNDPDIARQKRL